MKKSVLNFISLLMVAATVFSLVSCGKTTPENPDGEEPITSKSTTQIPVEIVDIPTDKGELVKMLNSAIEYVELYCYRYTKRAVCKVDGLNVGTLSTASNAAQAFRSIFGQKDVSIEYEYNTSRDSFAANFPQSGYTVNEVSSITAQQDDGTIILTAEFPSENNPSDKSGQLHKLSNDYLSVENVNKALTEFNSSAASVSVTASDIKIKATINAKDSSLQSLEVSFTQRFNLTGVTLVKIEGSGVTGASHTTVIYSSIGV
ncbi:MAG: hypothetical protein IKJ69_06275 [Clostridia bacterium]|nr:hypothetical protein [Clostridia bacterium]